MFETDQDRKSFLHRLGQVCASHGWRVHAWVLMGNHFHLLLETPQANLVSGMKRLMGAYSQGWNRARQRRGHVFQGRYKSVPVNGTDADACYFRIVADYIHLNPARAGLAGGEHGPLVRYRWSSLPCYVRGNAPDWLAMERVLQAFELARDGRGRRAYVAWLEVRAANDEGRIGEEAMAALRRGWYLGGETFKDRLLKLLEKRPDPPSGRSRTGDPLKDHGEREAERIVGMGIRVLDLHDGEKGLAAWRKSDPRKIAIASLLRERTMIGNAWISERLVMGHPGSVSRLLASCRDKTEWIHMKHELAGKLDEEAQTNTEM